MPGAQQVLACMVQIHEAGRNQLAGAEGQEDPKNRHTGTVPLQESLQGIVKALKLCMRVEGACHQPVSTTSAAAPAAAACSLYAQQGGMQTDQQQQQAIGPSSSAVAAVVQQLVWLCSTALHVGTTAIQAQEFGSALELMQAAVHFSASIKEKVSPEHAPAVRSMHLPALLAAVSLLLKHHPKVPNKAALLQLSHKLISGADSMVQEAGVCSREGHILLKLKCCLACHERAEGRLKHLLLKLAEHPLTTASDMHAMSLEVSVGLKTILLHPRLALALFCHENSSF
jgi:hypothetical protein